MASRRGFPLLFSAVPALLILTGAPGCTPEQPVNPKPSSTSSGQLAQQMRGKVIFCEVDMNKAVTANTSHIVIKNIGTATVDLTNWWIEYRSAGSEVLLQVGQNALPQNPPPVTLAAGSLIVVHVGHSLALPPAPSLFAPSTATTPLMGLAAAGGQVALFTNEGNPPFTSSTDMVDYMAYGPYFDPSTLHTLADVAFKGGLWPVGDYVNTSTFYGPVIPGDVLAHDGVPNHSSADWSSAAPSGAIQ